MSRSDYVIYIPTYRRVERQWTIHNIPDEFMPNTYLVCVADEADALAKKYECNVLVQPEEVKTIAQKRAWIIKQCQHEKMLMIDDDIKFCTRISEDSTKLLIQQERNQPTIIAAIHDWLDKLDDYVHAGISPRQANHTVGDYGHPNQRWVENVRMMYTLGYKTEIIQSCELGRINHREDMDYNLQLLRKGYPNAVAFYVACATYGYGAKGGESETREIEASNADAELLSKLHPGFVSIREKEYKYSVDRKEVVIAWKKAYKDGLSARNGELLFGS